MGRWKCSKCGNGTHTDYGEYTFIRTNVLHEISFGCGFDPTSKEARDFEDDDGRTKTASLCESCHHMTWVDDAPCDLMTGQHEKGPY